MKKIIIINSHMYSGSDLLYASLSKHSLIHGCKPAGYESRYLNNEDFVKEPNIKHKSNSKRSLFLDQILKNDSFSTKLDYSKCFIISVVREPKRTLESIMKIKKISGLFAARYYCYRLNRIYQVSKKAKNQLFITFQDIINNKKLEEIKNFLMLDEGVRPVNSFFEKEEKKEIVPKEYLKQAEESYEKYHYLLSKL